MLILRNGDGAANIIHSGEGVTQGDPLAMFSYRIGFLPMIKILKPAYPDITQTWYTDDAGALGTYFNYLKLHGPDRGY